MIIRWSCESNRRRDSRHRDLELISIDKGGAYARRDDCTKVLLFSSLRVDALVENTGIPLQQEMTSRGECNNSARSQIIGN